MRAYTNTYWSLTITNYFDSILHNRIAESLLGLSVSPRMVGLLFFILERLSYRDAYAESPRIGLPVDEFDCSRKLAHMALFPHDERMVKHVGEDAYVRWMDDQSFGVKSKADGLRVIAAIGESLSRLHLTPNAAKTHLLALPDARRHFHLDINQQLDDAEKMPLGTTRQRRVMAKHLRKTWLAAKKQAGLGEWSKILKRFYRLAALCGMKSFKRRAKWDILENPKLATRISAYIRCTGSVAEHIAFVESIWSDPEQPYGDVNLVLFEDLLRLEPKSPEKRILRRLGCDLLKRTRTPPGWADCAAVAPLFILRFGDKRSIPLLRRCFEKGQDLPPSIVRACAVVYATFGRDQYRDVRRAAARHFHNPLAKMIRLVDELLSYQEVPVRFKARIETRYDAVAGVSYVDMRSIATARLLKLNSNRTVKRWVEERCRYLEAQAISEYDCRLLRRLLC